MKRKWIAWMVLAAVLLAACNPDPLPVSSPVPGGSPYPESPVSSTPYPGPDINSPSGENPYPGPDTQATQNPYPDPLQPIQGEENMDRGEVFIDQSDLLILESMPPQYMLHIIGNLPTPCHHLRAQVAQPDEQNQIQVEVYSLVNPEEVCAQVLEPFETRINLGSFPAGKYTLFVNDEQVGEIDAP